MKKIKYILSSLVIFFIGALPFVIYADNTVPPTTQTTPAPTSINQSINIPNPLKGADSLGGLIVVILNNIVMPIAAVVSVMYIIWAGFKYVQAQGKPAEIQAANKNLLWALIGIGVLLGAAGISQVIQSTISSLIKV